MIPKNASCYRLEFLCQFSPLFLETRRPPPHLTSPLHSHGMTDLLDEECMLDVLLPWFPCLSGCILANRTLSVRGSGSRAQCCRRTACHIQPVAVASCVAVGLVATAALRLFLLRTEYIACATLRELGINNFADEQLSSSSSSPCPFPFQITFSILHSLSSHLPAANCTPSPLPAACPPLSDNSKVVRQQLWKSGSFHTM